MSTLNEARTALASGDKQSALQLVDQILSQSPSAEGWVLAAEIVETEADKIKCLTQALALDPNYEPARKQFAALGQLPPPRTSAPQPAGPLPLPHLDLPDEANEDTDKVRREGDAIVRVEGVYEMLWDCKFCGTKKLLGKTHKFCPVCGAQQDATWRYYPSDDEKVAVKDHKFVGADKVCPNCSSLNTADAEFCTRCGAPQSAASSVKAMAARQAAGTIGTPGVSFLTEDLDARQMAEKYGPPKQTQAKARPKWLPYAIGAVVIGIVAFALFAIFAKRDESGYVSAFDWERTIDVERYSAVSGSQICPAPADAYNVTRNYEQVGTRQVPDGESCTSRQVDQGDGTFRSEQVCTTKYRSEPVYDYVCYYTVNRWGYSRTSRAEGDKSAAPVWPATNVSGCLTLGCEREGTRREHYRVTITGDNDRTYTCDLPFETWQDTALESTFTFKVRIIGGGIDCSTLQRTG